MKRFLKDIINVTCILICLIVAVEIIQYYVSDNNYSYKYKYIKNHKDSIEGLILGHSHALRGIDPALLGKNVFNNAESAKWIYYDAKELSKYVPDMSNLRFVIYPIGYDMPQGFLSCHYEHDHNFKKEDNHDFNYGKAVIEQFVDQLDAICLCANIEGIRGIQKTAVVTLENGLRIGITGVTSHYISKWEPPENIAGLIIRNAYDAAAESLRELEKSGVDVKICIYHGGFEIDPETGKRLSLSDENQGWRICKELGYDILLSGHQHQLIEDTCIDGTYTCQPPDKACGFIRMTVEHDIADGDRALVSAHSCFVPAGEQRDENLLKILAESEKQASQWLDSPVGFANTEMKPDRPVRMASEGSLIANFFNQVQLEASGAQISVTSLSNSIAGFTKKIKCRDILVNYPFPNTLKTILVDRSILKQALERCAEL